MSNATLFRNILVDLPDFPAGHVEFILKTSLAAEGNEGFPKKTYTLTLNAQGSGTQALPVPTAGAWSWHIKTPDLKYWGTTLADGGDLQLTAWLVAAQTTETITSIADVYATIDDLDTHEGLTGTAVHGLGSAAVEDASAFDAAGSAATVQGNLDTHEGDTANPHAVTAAQAAALPEDATIVAVSATHTLLAGNAGKIHECNGTFIVTLPDGLDVGYQATVVNVGTGVITLAATTTLQSADAAVTLATQYKAAVVYHRGSDVWLAAGGLE
jgi:hypothetical protein